MRLLPGRSARLRGVTGVYKTCLHNSRQLRRVDIIFPVGFSSFSSEGYVVSRVYLF